VTRRGQVLVELAVTLPFILFLMLGSIEAGFLLIAKAHQDRSTSVVVEWAAAHPGESWNSVASRVLPGCDVTMTSPLPDLLEATARCQYQPVVLRMWDGLPMTSQESTASASPSASLSRVRAGSHS
jgi:hypothetical protein